MPLPAFIRRLLRSTGAGSYPRLGGAGRATLTLALLLSSLLAGAATALAFTVALDSHGSSARLNRPASPGAVVAGFSRLREDIPGPAYARLTSAPPTNPHRDTDFGADPGRRSGTGERTAAPRSCWGTIKSMFR